MLAHVGPYADLSPTLNPGQSETIFDVWDMPLGLGYLSYSYTDPNDQSKFNGLWLFNANVPACLTGPTSDPGAGNANICITDVTNALLALDATGNQPIDPGDDTPTVQAKIHSSEARYLHSPHEDISLTDALTDIITSHVFGSPGLTASQLKAMISDGTIGLSGYCHGTG